MANGKWKRFCNLVTRKRIVQDPKLETSNLRRCLNRWDLTALGLGSTLGVGVYVLIGPVGLRIAGPSIVLSFFIAAVATMMSGLCYSEFGSRVPMSGSVYVYSYVTVGEVMAFTNGWLLTFENLFGGASVARGLSVYVDSMFNGTLSSWLTSVAPLAASGEVFSHYFDLLSFFITVGLGVILAIGVRESSMVNNVLSAINMLVILFVIITGSFKADVSNWSIPESEVPEGFGVGGFFPYGVSGMLKGAAMCFYGFVGFDVISFTGEEVLDPRRTIPQAIILVLAIVMLSYCTTGAIITMMVPYYLLDGGAAIAFAFTSVGWDWARWVISVGAVFGIFSSLFASLFTLPRLLYAMASDGLSFHWFAHTIRKTPVFATILPALLTGLLAATVQLEQLILMMCVGTLISYTIVASCVILLRYKSTKPPVSSSYIKQVVGCGGKSATIISSRVAIIALLLFVTMCMVSALVGINFGWPLIPLATLHSVKLILLLIITLQPQVPGDIPFKTPLVPLIPCLSIYANIHLMILVNVRTWLRVFIWLLLGLPLYLLCLFFYKQKSTGESSPMIYPHSDKNGKAPVQIVVEAPTPPGTITKLNTHRNSPDDEIIEHKEKLDSIGKQAILKTDEVIVQQAFIEENGEKEAKIIDLLDQVLQAEEDNYVEQLSIKEDEKPQEVKSEEGIMVPLNEEEQIPHRKSLSELSDAGSDASFSNQELSKYNVIAQVHREDMPKVTEEEEKLEKESEDTDNDEEIETIENEDHEQITAFNDSETNSRTDESGYSDTIDRNALNDSVEDTTEEVPYIPPPPPFDENYFKGPSIFKKSYSIPPRPIKQKSMEEEEEVNKPRESVQSNSSQDDGSMVFGSNKQKKFMNKLNDIFQNKIANEPPAEDQRKRSNSTGAMTDNTEFSNLAMMRERPSLFMDLQKEIAFVHSVPNLKPVNTEIKDSNPDTNMSNEEESEDSSLSREVLKSKLEDIFATGGPMMLKPRLMKSNPPTPEDSNQTDSSSTDSIPKLPKMDKNDTLKRQKDKFSAVLNSFRLSLNKDDAV